MNKLRSRRPEEVKLCQLTLDEGGDLSDLAFASYPDISDVLQA